MTKSNASALQKNSVGIGETSVAITDKSSVVDAVIVDLRNGLGGVLVTPNLDHLEILSRDAEFRAAYSEATLRVADGTPLLWLSRFTNDRLSERIPGSDLIWDLAEAAAKHTLPIALVGGSEGSAAETASILKARFPGLQTSFVTCPPFGFREQPETIARLEQDLADLPASIVFLAFGAPLQEQLAVDLKADIDHHWYVCVGGSFDMIAGAVARAPKLVQRVGLEWAWRLGQEPRRLFSRYIVRDLPYLGRLMFKSALRKRSNQ